MPELPIDHAVCDPSEELARTARSRGITVPAADIVISACARRHGAEIESAEDDFALLASAT